MDSYLTLDMGNTNASLAFVSFVGGLSVRRLCAWSVDSGAPEFEDAGVARVAGISAVGAVERELKVAQRLEGAGYSVLSRPDAGLIMDIDFPETCGSDRQYAMRAALADQLESHGAAATPQVLVVDAGTALTVDAGRAEFEGGEAQMTFLGGAIAMGPGSLTSAMAARGARLPEFGASPDAPALGRSTVEALQSGVAVGFRGAVRELVHQVAVDAFGSQAGVAIYLTGGARSFARRAVSESSPAGFHEDAHLVHAGLGRVLHSMPHSIPI